MAKRRVFKGFRLHIGLFGRRNVGKSSVLNAIVRQRVSIVHDTAGTTTDPVEKTMELLPIGPVLFIDTAGIDDVGALGEMRVEKTRKALSRTDLGVIVTDGVVGDFERMLIAELQKRQTPVVVVFNKIDVAAPDNLAVIAAEAAGAQVVRVSALERDGFDRLRQTLLASAPEDFLGSVPVVSDLVPPGEFAVLVVPIDKEAPKGRLIMPQVQSIRDLLDNESIAIVTKERELVATLDNLKKPPALVVTDSQAFLKVAADTPLDIPLTSFSVLFSRFKGDLISQVRGALAVEQLKSGDQILVAEACSHHPIGEDIGRVKIPRWLTQYVGGKLEFTTVQGRDFPDDLTPYKLVIHCGGCMHNRKEMLTRLSMAQEQGVPMTNYGLVIAYSLGIFKRALSPFPAALLELEK